ncbi:hypothetical protein, partial [Salmonella enterica]|uniref:hypothetical protein n=1 Tax=Salmonella enterica TaxID=28901 RepID=UPI003D289448
ATRAEYVKRYSERIGLSEEALHLEVKRYEQAQNPGFQRLSRDFRKGGQKKAISKGGSPSLWRSENGVPDNLSELRAQLT